MADFEDSLAFQGASYFHRVAAFMELFTDNPKLLTKDLLDLYPQECNDLMTLMVKESNLPLLLRK